MIKLAFFRLSHGLLLYSERAKRIGASSGYPENRIKVIFNSLDYDTQKVVREDLMTSAPVPVSHFLYIGRLNAKVNLELAFDALAKLNIETGQDIPFCIIGDGPELEKLEAHANKLGIAATFVGSIYDENVIGSYLFNAIATVSPGKVGLTAMHSLAYGTPIITHGNLDFQMPEVEVILPGVTGSLFEFGCTDALCTVMREWLERTDRAKIRSDCIAVIEQNYTPQIQQELIEAAIRKYEL